MVISWLMIGVGVIVTAIQTHSLAYNGMKGSKLYADWLDVASWLPVILLHPDSQERIAMLEAESEYNA